MTHGNTVHGHSRRTQRSGVWLAWASMHRRCSLPSQDSYPIYGGRGVKVCERWLKFENFLADMGEKPPGMTLERKDSNGSYEPENCRWATQKEQQRNRSTNRLIEHEGQTLTVIEWAERTGIPSSAIRARIDRLGWSVGRALSEPLVPAEESLRKAKAAQKRPPVEEYVVLLAAGKSCVEIGTQFGITSSAVRKVLQRAGINAGDYTQTSEARRSRAKRRA